MAASATFALNAGVWFRRGRLGMVSPDSQATACLPSGRNSTYRPVQISGTGSPLAGHIKPSGISTRQFARWEARERGCWQNRKRDYKHEHGSSTAAPVAVD